MIQKIHIDRICVESVGRDIVRLYHIFIAAGILCPNDLAGLLITFVHIGKVCSDGADPNMKNHVVRGGNHDGHLLKELLDAGNIGLLFRFQFKKEQLVGQTAVYIRKFPGIMLS